MESLLKEFELEHKNPSEDALLRWRKAVSKLTVKNPRRRFRMVADLAKRSEALKKKRSIQNFPFIVERVTLDHF
ncbi:conserved hypothetical protein [Ricinus communis]|uniref:Calcium-transporting P-type ATPase N-terminal autoinhibitory domain-containing protein n=1 Tax=Ricinus communis TaxID=3988 RepID=B9TMH2_RICCO|nr:conserved hypothetical protein [Ricinus communis]